jgi:hypothetical protein
MRILAICLALSWGCMSVSSTTIGSPPHEMSARPATEVEIFASGPPARQHVDVALIRANDGSLRWKLDDLVAALRERAAALGCDAIVITDSHGNAMVATCIVYSDGAPGSVATGP